jgi:predicted nucleic acid-binding protein
MIRLYRQDMRHFHEEYLVLEFDADVLNKARSLVFKYPLRTLDAIQLASAVEVQGLLSATVSFVSADTRLLDAARAEGFAVENPLSYP